MTEFQSTVIYIILMVLVNYFLLRILFRLIRRTKELRLGGELYASTPAKPGCGPHFWEIADVPLEGKIKSVLYCTNCGSVSGSDERFLKPEPLDRLNKQRVLMQEFKEAKYLMIKAFTKELKEAPESDPSEAEKTTIKFLEKVAEMEKDFLLRARKLMRMNGTD